MSDKMKIKDLKICLEEHPELREQFAAIARGESDCLVLDCVEFEDLCIDEVKTDVLKIDDMKVKRGRIKCLKIRFYEPKC